MSAFSRRRRKPSSFFTCYYQSLEAVWHVELPRGNRVPYSEHAKNVGCQHWMHGFVAKLKNIKHLSISGCGYEPQDLVNLHRWLPLLKHIQVADNDWIVKDGELARIHLCYGIPRTLQYWFPGASSLVLCIPLSGGSRPHTGAPQCSNKISLAKSYSIHSEIGNRRGT
jgi:hypothetical protein